AGWAAADASAACGRPDDAARARLAAAQLLQSIGNFRAALAAIDDVFSLLSPGAPPEFRSRALSLDGVVRAKLGDIPRALESVRSALSEALVAGHPNSAAAAYQAVAIVYENAGELGQAIEAYDVAI